MKFPFGFSSVLIIIFCLNSMAQAQSPQSAPQPGGATSQAQSPSPQPQPGQSPAAPAPVVQAPDPQAAPGSAPAPSQLPAGANLPMNPQINTENQATAVPAEVISDKLQYDPTLGRDPFKIPMVNVDKFRAAVPVINEDSLEGANIPEGVKVLAIIHDSKKPRALVQKLANKKAYLVFNKSRLGAGGGIVSEIREDEIVVVRTVETEGQTVVENIVLRLNNKKRKEDIK